MSEPKLDRSKRLYVYWGVALGSLLALGLVCWTVVVPFLQTRASVSRYHQQLSGLEAVPYSPFGETERGLAESEVQRLGGAQPAVRRLALYLRLPARIAPHRFAAASMLAYCGVQSGPAVPQLLKLLDHEDIGVRTVAAFALGEARDRRAVEALIAAMGTRKQNECRIIVYALGKIGDTRAVEPFIAYLKGSDYERMADAAYALRIMKDARSVPPLIEILRDRNGDRFSRGWAADTLGEIGDLRAVSPLIEELECCESRLSVYLVTALGRLGDRRAVPALEKLIQDKEKSRLVAYADACRAAGEALKMIREKNEVQEEGARKQ